MRTTALSFFLLFFGCQLGASCLGAPAHFWISDDGVSPDGPNVATNIVIEESTVGTLYIWGRPESGKKLRNISLNVVAMQAGIDFIDSSITMHNDAGSGTQRYEYVSDQTSSPVLTSEESLADVANGSADAIELLQGFTLSSSSASIKGVGNQCVGIETGCVLASDGLPAWLIAEVQYNAIAGGPATDVHLQIGSHGMNHESLVSGDYDLNGVVDSDDLSEVENNYGSTTNLWADGNGNGIVDLADYTIWRDNLGSSSSFEASSMTSIRFGGDTSDGFDEPIYNAGTDRDTTLAMDDPEATITIVAPLSVEPIAVPEPATFGLLGAALIALLPRRCKSLHGC